MELIFVGLAAWLCSPLLKEEKKPSSPPKSDGSLTVIVIDCGGKVKSGTAK